MDKIDAQTALAQEGGSTFKGILAVPARRCGELVETFRSLAFDADGLVEATFAGHRLIVTRDLLAPRNWTSSKP